MTTTPAAEKTLATNPDFRTAPTDGLYRADKERDSCGVGFIANISNEASHEIVEQGLKILVNLEHRGATGADPRMGDGAGILVQMPHAFFAAEAERLGFVLPPKGEYAVGMFFMMEEDLDKVAVIEAVLADEGLKALGWRDVPVNSDAIPASVQASEPHIKQLFVARNGSSDNETDFERRLYIARKVLNNKVYDGRSPAKRNFVVCSMSCRTVVYKGMFLADQLGAYYPDLSDPRFASALALVHQRFSTNTFPSWGLAHPYRMVAHNGEINTLRGNVNWMAARQATAHSQAFRRGDLASCGRSPTRASRTPRASTTRSSSSCRAATPLGHAMAMLVPEAWAGNPLMDEDRRAFYEYHAALMEPWDGPAAIVFTDGRQIGATLDRNGLRPARYCVTHGRPRRARLGGRRAADRGGADRPQVAAAAGQDAADRPRGAPHHLRRGGEARPRGRSQPYGEWLKPRARSSSRTSRPVCGRGRRGPTSRCSIASRRSATPRKTSSFCWRRWPTTGQEAARLDGHRHAAVGALRQARRLLYTYFKQNCSRRSPTRRSTRSAKSW